METRRAWILALGLLLAACGGGGGGGPTLTFALSGTVPTPGTVTANTDGTLAITFTLPADLATVTTQTLELERGDGTPVVFEIIARGFNPTNVQLRPFFPLLPNTLYRWTISGSIVSLDGLPLGADIEICFITANPTPTIRPDQVVDLGDRMVTPRSMGRHVRLPDGRHAVIGGFSDPDTVTDTIEIWDPVAQGFDLMPFRLNTPRAEHTATVMSDGRVLIVGGVTEPGGAPLATTEFFDPGNNGVAPGPVLNVARRWHAASGWNSGAGAVVSGGFDAAGNELDSIEILSGATWQFHVDPLPVPTVKHIHFLFGFDTVYFSAGNLQGGAGQIRPGEVERWTEGDTRFRTEARLIPGNRLLVVGGDTRSIVVHDFAQNISWGATDFLRDRRGAYSLTPRGTTGRRFLAAGGFRISAGGERLSSLEIVEYLPAGPFGLPDAVVFTVQNVQLPVPFAGHFGFVDTTGVTVLAGGAGDGVGPHSRRVVLIRDGDSTVTCD